MIRIFSALFEAGTTQLDKLKATLFSILIATFIGMGAVLYFRPSITNAFLVIAIPYAYTIYRLLSTERLLFVHAAGESLELIGALGEKKEGAVETGIFENEVTTKYVAIVKGVFLGQSILFLMTPLYVNYTAGDIPTAIMIGMLTLVVAVGSSVFFIGMFTFASRVTIFCYFVAIVCMLFPQSTYYFNQLTGNKFSPSSIEAYRLANEIKAVRDSQLEERKISQLRSALDYQKSNPGQQLPLEYQKKIEEVGMVDGNASQPQQRKEVMAMSQERTVGRTSSSSVANARLERMAREIYGK